MSKRETDRALLRAFGDAARAIQEPTRLGRLGAWTTAQILLRGASRLWDRADDRLRSRRQRHYLRCLALAADTAFGN